MFIDFINIGKNQLKDFSNYNVEKDILCVDYSDYKQFLELKLKDIKSCLVFSKPVQSSSVNNLKSKFTYFAVKSAELSEVNYWINKNIDFIINPFSDRLRGFDYSTINIIKQKKIIPVIILSDMKNYNLFQKAYFLKSANDFAEYSKIQKIPLIIVTGQNIEDNNYKINKENYFSNYVLFDFTPEQGKMYQKMVFE
jgi:hypothetical protein